MALSKERKNYFSEGESFRTFNEDLSSVKRADDIVNSCFDSVRRIYLSVTFTNHLKTPRGHNNKVITNHVERSNFLSVQNVRKYYCRKNADSCSVKVDGADKTNSYSALLLEFEEASYKSTNRYLFFNPDRLVAHLTNHDGALQSQLTIVS